MDTRELKMLAEAAHDERKAWEQAGKPWPIWCECAYNLHATLTGSVALDLLAELECARGDLKMAMELISKLQANSERYELIKSRACTEDRDGGYTGFWRLPCMPGWDGTPYSRSRKEGYDYRDSLDKSIDSVIAKERS